MKKCINKAICALLTASLIISGFFCGDMVVLAEESLEEKLAEEELKEDSVEKLEKNIEEDKKEQIEDPDEDVTEKLEEEAEEEIIIVVAGIAVAIGIMTKKKLR